ncbi:class I SAM-dependent methyltransferase [Tsukamurella tyrosinosolvens]|uniref:class I SAM-dependent methyltransferase n=1 Tax=Tsukamurella tyrosinosolvens TaxID=57704 RepID=UPI000DF6D245|nr:class I SAM-dependent methyltransferase [Tsukamurella tyrosinosolvens]RDB49100.1 class I SAM-dependent methyltransferase [Tsukamurella tyrosinosolvens]
MTASKDQSSASAAAAYDSIADAYAELNATSILNEYYNRPAIREFLGDVTGKHVLDAGCGSGPTLVDLIEGGATAVGFDGSSALIDIARERVGTRADLHVADLGEPFPFEDGTFDDVVCALALHYLEGWHGPLSEMHRVLKPGGRVILSVEHPFVMWFTQLQEGTETNYFATRARHDTEMAGMEVDLMFWDRSLSTMFKTFADCGFRVTHLDEPAPSPEAVERFPDFFKGRDDPRFLAFLFAVLEKPAD